MELEIRAHTPDELWDYRTAVARGFGYYPREEPGERELYVSRHEPERTVVAATGGKMVGTSVAYSYGLSVPGGKILPVAAVSDVTVAVTHRRRGILTQMMRRQLGQARERGEPASVLWASESLLYRRFGFGMAVQHERWDIPREHGTIAHMPDTPGEVRFASPAEIRTLARDVYERTVELRPGMVTRNDAWWNTQLFDPEHRRGGMSAFFYAVYEEDGRTEGYIQYRIDNVWTKKHPDKSLKVVELMAATDSAHAALWQFCMSVDLVTTVTSEHQPVDDPLWWMLTDPRWLHREPFDAVWLRIIDPVKMLSSRTYSTEDKLVFEVRDKFCPWVAGRYEIDGGPAGAEVRPTNAEPDITMWGAGLGACYLGGSRFSSLVRAGRMEAKSADAMRRADLMFTANRAPWCPQEF
ncbi:MAG: GNAT family N-acetyltransferase [Dehalococcoidia bacterium]